MMYSAITYSKEPVEVQVRMQLTLIRHYAEDWYDMPSFNELDFRDGVLTTMKADLKKLEKDEKYELCSIYRDAIENMPYISLRKLL